MQSPNFDVLSSAGSANPNTLTYFEQVREFFLKFNGHAPRIGAGHHRHIGWTRNIRRTV